MNTIIFDFDGTIADTIPSTSYMTTVFNRLSDEYGFEKLTEKEIEELRQQNLRTILKILRIPLWRVPFLIREVQMKLKKELSIAKPVEGMKPLLLDLKKKRYYLGILTSSKEELVHAFLKRNGLEVFDIIYTGSSLFGKDKVLINLLHKAKLEPNEIVYVGDEIRDIEAAKKTKVQMISVTWGFNTRHGLEKYNPDVIVDTPKELARLLLKPTT